MAFAVRTGRRVCKFCTIVSTHSGALLLLNERQVWTIRKGHSRILSAHGSPPVRIWPTGLNKGHRGFKNIVGDSEHLENSRGDFDGFWHLSNTEKRAVDQGRSRNMTCQDRGFERMGKECRVGLGKAVARYTCAF